VCVAAAFENIVQALYTNVVPKPKSDCSKTEQLGVSFAAGYLAGILCAIISHPADNLVSKLNASKVNLCNDTDLTCILSLCNDTLDTDLTGVLSL